LLTSHLLPAAAFTALAEGAGRPATIRLLHDAQLSKHLMLLHAIAEAADTAAKDTAAVPDGPAAFRAGYALLAEIQAEDQKAAGWLLGLPHLGGYAHDCLIRLEQGSAADFAYFACLAASAAVRGGVPFELDVPVRDGHVLLPGLGFMRIADDSSWARLCCDGDQVTVGRHLQADRRYLVPDDGSGGPVPQWSGTPVIRAMADGLVWQALLETEDSYLDRYTLPMARGLTAEDVGRWRRCAQAAWEVLVRNHRWAAEPLPDVVSVIVPLTPRSDTDLVSATTPAAFGAIATSWPPDPVTMAETLVHEGQHVKLCGLLDMVPLVAPGEEKVYAPWRQDPRPAGGLLQGVYAHLGIARFWAAQRHAETDPDDLLRAEVHFARWRSVVDQAAQTLLRTDCLTPAGVRFVELLRVRGKQLQAEPVPGQARDIAAQVALDHWLTWQLRHLALDPAGVASLAAARRRGESAQDIARPGTWIEADVRKVDASVRSRLMTMRYLAPARYRELCADGMLVLSEPDRLLVSGRAQAAVRAYRDEITASADPRLEAWIGLALALHQLPPSPLQMAFAAEMALIFELHSCLGDQSDPLDLASWFA
jgi:HEXXH motif-containing protein